jgi:uncharacterized ferritin-like protein (DUF455 family)
MASSAHSAPTAPAAAATAAVAGTALPSPHDAAVPATAGAAGTAVSGTCLQALAIRVLLTPSATDKAALTLAICEAWLAGSVPLHPPAPGATGGGGAAPLPTPASPERPPGVLHVHPTRVKNGTKKHTLHALCHAESYAIDLTWDLIARFGWSPETWQPAGAAAAGAALPRAFFDDWVRVAGEEAVHFSRWHARLAELGAAYGDYPAHGSLWESAEDTAHSLAARLAVVHCVHEGRGLDVAATLRAKLAAGGDEASAAILTRNLAEEVTHVAAGVRWLTQLCAWGGQPSPIPTFHALVRRHFHGALRPPFAVAERGVAGMSEEWYMPLCAAAAAAGAGSAGAEPLSATSGTAEPLSATSGTIELTAEDMG